mgnify:CR=1
MTKRFAAKRKKNSSFPPPDGIKKQENATTNIKFQKTNVCNNDLQKKHKIMSQNR